MSICFPVANLVTNSHDARASLTHWYKPECTSLNSLLLGEPTCRSFRPTQRNSVIQHTFFISSLPLFKGLEPHTCYNTENIKWESCPYIHIHKWFTYMLPLAQTVLRPICLKASILLCWSNAQAAMPRDRNSEQDIACSHKATRALSIAPTPAVTPGLFCCQSLWKRPHICPLRVQGYGSGIQSKGASATHGGCCGWSLSSWACPRAHAHSRNLQLRKQKSDPAMDKSPCLRDQYNKGATGTQSSPHTYSSLKKLMKDTSQKQRALSNEMIKEKIQLKTPETHYNLISHNFLGTLNITWISLCSTKPTSYSTEPTLVHHIQAEMKLSCISDKCTRE